MTQINDRVFSKWLVTGLMVAVVGATPTVAETPAPPKAKVSFYRDIRPILQQHCQGCHQPAKPQGGYIMTQFAELWKAGNSGKEPIVAGKPEQSYLVQQIVPQGDKPAAMPKNKEPLAAYQIDKIKQWIAEGAVNDTPPSVQQVVYDEEHPPVYELPPVITSIDFSPDGQLLAVAGYHEVLVHKADGSQLIARLIGASERIQSVAFSPDGKTLAVTGGNPGRMGEIQLWDVSKKKLKLAVPMTYDTVNGASWSPDGKKLAFGCNDNSLRAIDTETGEQVLYQGAHNDWVLETTFSLDGAYLVSVSRDRAMKLTEVATQRFIDNITSITPGALKGGLATVALRPLKERRIEKQKDVEVGGGEHLYNEVLAAGADGTPRLYRMHRNVKRVIGDDANKLKEYEPMPGRIYSVAWDADGQFFVSGSSSDGRGEVRVYNATDGSKVVMKGSMGGIYTVRFVPGSNPKLVASAGFDGLVRFHNALTGELVKEFFPVPLTKK
jgi:WD40 repeat protein